MLTRSAYATTIATEDELDSLNSAYDYVLIDSQSSRYSLIGSKEARVWELLGEHHELADLAAVMSLETGKFEQRYIEKLIKRWVEEGFVVDNSIPIKPKKKKFWQKIFWWEIQFKGFDKYLDRFWRLVHFVFKYNIPQGGIFVISVSGLILLIQSIINGHAQFFEELTLPLFVLLIATGLIMLALHELGHAMAMKWAGAQVLRAGIGLYLGLPIAFVDTSTVWAKRRSKRIVTACGGILMNLFIISIVSWLSYLLADPFLQTLMWEIMFMNVVMIAFSLLPFIKMDGYYILLDLLGIPNLQKVAFGELKELEAHPRKFRFNRRNSLFIAFGFISLICSGLLFLYSGWYWWRLVSTLVRLV